MSIPVKVKFYFAILTKKLSKPFCKNYIGSLLDAYWKQVYFLLKDPQTILYLKCVFLSTLVSLLHQ